MAKLKINLGEKKGMLTCVSEGERKVLPSGQTNRTVNCVCDCGSKVNIRLLHWTRDRIKSCGCKNNILNKPKYTNQERYLVRIYKAIKERCYENYIDSHIYYHRGITVCDEWLNNPLSFVEWGIANGLKKGLQIDRIDNEKGYSPENCRVVTSKQNVNNRRVTFYVEYKGDKYAFTDLIELKGLNKHEGAIRRRIKRGWSVDKAFDTPIRKGNYYRK